MVLQRFVAAGLVAVLLVLGGVACGDDPGEDTIGDEEINDEGD
jgi:hypothetical protein